MVDEEEYTFLLGVRGSIVAGVARFYIEDLLLRLFHLLMLRQQL